MLLCCTKTCPLDNPDKHALWDPFLLRNKSNMWSSILDVQILCVKLDDRNLIPRSSGVGRGYSGVWGTHDFTERTRFCYQELTGVLELMFGNMLTHSRKSKNITNDFCRKRNFLFWKKGLSFSMDLFLLLHWNKRLRHELEAFLPTNKTTERWHCQATTAKLVQRNRLTFALKIFSKLLIFAPNTSAMVTFLNRPSYSEKLFT